MKGLLAVASAHKAATVVVVGAVLGVGGVVNAVSDSSTTATLERVVDGDTIDVEYDGETHRVRLLNVNTPESVDPDKPVECLGPEASDWLKQRLPVGTEVRLERDQETQDRYGRELAAVFAGEELINAEIARAGLGVPMSVGANTKYLPPVEAAAAEARNAGHGLYATDIPCTLPAQVGQLEASADSAVSQAPPSTAAVSEFDSHAAELAAVTAAAKSLAGVLDGDATVFPLIAYANQVSDFRHRLQMVENRIDSATTQNSAARKTRQRQLEAEAQRAAEEAARKAAEEAAQRAAAEAAAQAARRSSSTSGGTSSRSSNFSTPAQTAAPTRAPSGSGSGGPSGYTGCRSYAPGGKTWTPIPC